MQRGGVEEKNAIIKNPLLKNPLYEVERVVQRSDDRVSRLRYAHRRVKKSFN
jgi:hypothetical protein